MRRQEPQLCADCGAPTNNLLCDRCAEVCDILTPAGRYYNYRRARRSGNVRPAARRTGDYSFDRWSSSAR